EAVVALGLLAEKNKALIPVLVASLEDKDYKVADEASKALSALGAEVVPALLKVLKDHTSSTSFMHAAHALGRIGAKAKAAVPLLNQALKGDDREVRRPCVFALGRIGPDAKPAIPAMIAAL